MIILIHVNNPTLKKLEGKLIIRPIGQINEFPIDPDLNKESQAIFYLCEGQSSLHFCLEFLDYNNDEILLCLLTDQLKRKVNNEWLVDPNGKVFLSNVSCNRYYIFIKGSYNHINNGNKIIEVNEENNGSNDYNYEVMLEIPENPEDRRVISAIFARYEKEGF